MILSSNISMYLDGVLTPMHNPSFGMSHPLSAVMSFEDVLDAGVLSCLTITAENTGSTRASIEGANTVRFSASTDSGVVEINGSVYQINDVFSGTHYSVVFVVS